MFPKSVFALCRTHALRARSSVHSSALLIHSSVCLIELCLSPPQTSSNPVVYKLGGAPPGGRLVLFQGGHKVNG